MKLNKIILAGVIATAFASASFAQSGAVNEQPVAIPVEEKAIDVETSKDNGTEIKLSELPTPVQEALKSDPYKDWISKRAWIVTRDGNKFYRVEVENPKNESTTILFDANGKVLD